MIYSDVHLEHHGIQGQKWGVENGPPYPLGKDVYNTLRKYDRKASKYEKNAGSYTVSGLKRYTKSKNDYVDKATNADNANKTLKEMDSKGVNKDSYEYQKAMNDKLTADYRKKEAEDRMKKDVKHLKEDKKADKGKALYKSGKTIRGNDAVTSVLSTVGSIAVGVAIYNERNHVVDPTVSRAIGAAGIGMYAIAGGKKIADEYQARQLRAYYGHTSKY